MKYTDFTTIQIAGEKNACFLHQLCTQSVLHGPVGLTYTGFLNHKGRVLFDAYLYFPEVSCAWVILPRCQLVAAISHFQYYAPFSKVMVTHIDHVWSAGKQGLQITNMPYSLSYELYTKSEDDSRVEGYAVEEKIKNSDWCREEILYGIPRIRFVNAGKFTTHMLDFNKLNAVSYTKGCYIGQEITHRAEMRGVNKKGLYRGYTDEQNALIVHSFPEMIALYVMAHLNNTALTRVYA